MFECYSILPALSRHYLSTLLKDTIQKRPKGKIADVVSILPDLVAADDRVKEEVMKGMSAQEAFKKHRG